MRDERKETPLHQSLTEAQKAEEVINYSLIRGRFIKQQPLHRRMQELMSKHNHLLIWAFLEAGKTHQVIARVLFELGHNPDLRIAIFSNTQKLARKVTATIADYIENSVRLKEVFPNLKKGAGPWNTEALTVMRSPGIPIKDPSVQCLPVRTGAAQGARIDIAILDDVYTAEEYRSDAKGEHLWDWYHKTIHGRADRVWMIGNVFSPDDFMHRLEQNKAVWVGERFSLLDPDDMCVWPAMWPDERIRQVREGMTPEEFARTFLCIPRDDASAWFKRTTIDKCLKLGEGLSLKQGGELRHILPGYKIYTGVDLGHRVKKTSDQTVFFTFAEKPDGCRRILEILCGRWMGSDIVDRILDVHRRFGSIIHVESVAAQQFILDFTRKVSRVPVVEFQTDKRKHDNQFGVQALAVEMANGKWEFPSDDGTLQGAHKEVQALCHDLTYYDPREHTGDRLMAMWIGVEGSRRLIPPNVQTGNFRRRV